MARIIKKILLIWGGWNVVGILLFMNESNYKHLFYLCLSTICFGFVGVISAIEELKQEE